MQCMISKAEMITKSYKIQSCENTKITCKNKHLKHKNGQKNLKLYLFIEMYLFKKKKNELELYSIEQGSQTVDIKKKTFVL